MENPMPKGQLPEYQFFMTDENGKSHDLGAAWATNKENIFGVAVDLEGTGEKLRFAMRKIVRPIPKAKPATTLKPAA
jgi:hypothetical protein